MIHSKLKEVPDIKKENVCDDIYECNFLKFIVTEIGIKK